MVRRASALVLALAFAGAPAGAEPEPGDLFVSEGAGGSVVNVRSGGDLAAAPRYATGLSAPSGLCVTGDGRLLVAESGSGEITDISAGGDFTDAAAFATGLDTPRGLLCEGESVLAVEAGPSGEGEITDASAGGDLGGAVPFASGLGAGATALLRVGEGEPLFASDASGRIFDASAGGPLGAPFAENGAGTAGLAAFAGKLLAAEPAAGRVVEFGAGGDLAALPVFATLPGAVALLPVPGLGLVAASGSTGALYDASAGGDLAAAAPLASGLALDPAFAGLAHVAGCGDGVIDPEADEQCDDGNRQNGDGCDDRCRVRLCLLPPPPGCIEASEGRLSIRQKGEGDKLRASFSLELGGFAEAVEALDFGNPVFDVTRYDLCVYGEAQFLVGQLIVNRGFDTCGPRDDACWRLLDERGYRFRDKDRESAGIDQILLEGGPAGGGRIRVSAKRTKKSQRLPRMTETLAGDAFATIRLMSSHGRCFAATLDQVKRADEGRFVGSTD